MQNDNLMKKRHTLAHLLAAAVLENYPDTLLTLGPAIDNGFYYDMEFTEALTDADLPKIEKTMKKLLPKWTEFTHKEVSVEEAREIFAKNPYKLELVEEIAGKGEKITLYSCGGFTDLCRGGHSENPAKEIALDSFKLDKIAGAYWRGDEKNKMLTRIYGLAFDTAEELEKHLKMLEEAKERDHRKLGKELDIFEFDEDVGAGLPLWLPNGTVIIEQLEKLAFETERQAGYKRVRTPHLAKESMYLKSGHLPYYEEGMFPPMEYEGGKYYLRAMNCPHHHKVFAARPKSYKDLPLRLAEYGTVYRHEKSGELFGLMRVRMLQMNDAHIYCTEEQFFSEFKAVIDMYLKYFKIFGIEKYVMRLSKHSKDKLGKKYVDEPELWVKTEEMVRKCLVDLNVPFVEAEDEAAFYGPKIDVQIWSAIGREFTLATNQVDFAVPKRFDLEYTDKDGKKKTPLCIHRAPLSTHERFIGFLIEHFAGAFPFWLAPTQVAIIAVKDDLHSDFAKEIHQKLFDSGIRAELMDAKNGLGKNVREAKSQKIPFIMVIGDKEKESGKFKLEGVEESIDLSIEEVLEKFSKLNKI